VQNLNLSGFDSIVSICFPIYLSISFMNYMRFFFFMIVVLINESLL
jgi:hypothetical protein